MPRHTTGVRIAISGRVQGVGFRPFVHRLSKQLGVQGWVRNGPEGVEINGYARRPVLQDFVLRLREEAPRQARIDRMDVVDLRDNDPVETGFRVLPSVPGACGRPVGPDLGVCPACLAELFDRTNRRWRHPFIACTDCGPRYSILIRTPWDRCHTSMARFPLCPACQSEYTDPTNRRFHAEPIACHDCGPTLRFIGADRNIAPGDPIETAARVLRQGGILAVKGVGGFHLMGNAADHTVVSRLRQSKTRETKPLAVMVAGVASAEAIVHVRTADAGHLTDQRHPIVLLHRKADPALTLAPNIAPGIGDIGVMLPYAPVHLLLFHALAGTPTGTLWLRTPLPFALVCTSANDKDEPLIFQNNVAFEKLGPFVDGFLVHDRDIIHRLDDSVIRGGDRQFAISVRRTRGFVPDPISVADGPGPVFAVGGLLKNTQCLLDGDKAYVSAHLGDLITPDLISIAVENVEELTKDSESKPVMVACDLNLDFASTRLAETLARRWRVPILRVQHHHAHVAAVACEHNRTGPLLGLALDGVGLGTDGTAWGGELLRLDGGTFQRLGHLAPLPLPGGDRAAEEPWRMAAAVLHRLGRASEITRRYPGITGGDQIKRLLDTPRLCPLTTSAGRLFDAAAALLGICSRQSYEGEAAIRLETAADAFGPAPPFEGGWSISDDGVIDFLPLLDLLSEEAPPDRGAAIFHSSVVAGMTEWLSSAGKRSGLSTVALGGGCFINRILRQELAEALQKRGFEVLTARHLPPNDAAISLGQAFIARRTLENGQPCA